MAATWTFEYKRD